MKNDNVSSARKKAMTWAETYLMTYGSMTRMNEACAHDSKYKENARELEKLIEDKLQEAEKYGADTAQLRGLYTQTKSKIEQLMS